MPDNYIATDYVLLGKQLEALLVNESNPITNLSQFSALVFNSMQKINWAGFYLRSDVSTLQLGPFQGEVACSQIPIGRGVCGTSASKKKSVLVDDVDQFASHIACDSRSRSEIVCPLIFNGTLIGVFDVDSPILNRFNENDKQGLETLLKILSKATNLELLNKLNS